MGQRAVGFPNMKPGFLWPLLTAVDLDLNLGVL